MTAVATAKFNRYQIYSILKNYAWMLREIQRIDKELTRTDFTGVSQYGIEASLPHAQGIVGRAIENEVMRRNRKSDKLLKYCEEVNFINENVDKVTDEKEKVVLDCLLDGMSITAIAHHLRMSRQQVHTLQNDIVKRMAK